MTCSTDLGRQLSALRDAVPMTQAALGRRLAYSRRLTVRAFAAHIGVATATVCCWERRDRAARLHLATEEMLDRALKLADADARSRFIQLLAKPGTQA